MFVYISGKCVSCFEVMTIESFALTVKIMLHVKKTITVTWMTARITYYSGWLVSDDRYTSQKWDWKHWNDWIKWQMIEDRGISDFSVTKITGYNHILISCAIIVRSTVPELEPRYRYSRHSVSWSSSLSLFASVAIVALVTLVIILNTVVVKLHAFLVVRPHKLRTER